MSLGLSLAWASSSQMFSWDPLGSCIPMGFLLKFGTWEWFVWLLFLLKFAVRGPHTHSRPQPLGIDGWYMHKRHTASSAGERNATYPLSPGCAGGMLCISLPWGRQVLAALRRVCCPCVCTGAELPQQQHTLAALVSCPVCSRGLCRGRNRPLSRNPPAPTDGHATLFHLSVQIRP